jgi:hypothetical protein
MKKLYCGPYVAGHTIAGEEQGFQELCLVCS